MTKIKKDKKTGKYFFIFEAGYNEEGKRKQLKRKGFLTKNDAQLALAKLQIEEGYLTKTIALTFDVFLSNWFNSKKIKLKPSTIKNYQEQISYNILPYLGKLKMEHLNEETVQNCILKLHKDRGLAPATIRSSFGLIREVIRNAASKDLVNADFLTNISLPREKRKIRVWDEQQLSTFLQAPNIILNLSRHFIGLVISVQTGMRMGEVLGLRWKDIDMDNKMIVIRQTLSQIGDNGEYGLVDEGKTQAALRSIYISSSLVHALIEHRRLIEREKMILGNAYQNYDLVVCAKDGNWVHHSNLRRAFKVTIEQLDIPNIRFHDLRHTHATFLLANKVSPKIIQERLGHKNVSVTLNTYSHALPSMQLEAVGKFDEIFAKM